MRWCSRGTDGILAGNPDLADVITMPAARRARRRALALLRRCGERYDLAVSTQSGDRPTLFAWARGPAQRRLRRGGRAWRRGSSGARSTIRSSSSRRLHRFEEMLRLADALGVAPVAEVVVPRGATRRACAGPALCGDPCGADVSLQALDRGGLARARGRACGARPRGARDRRARARRAALSRRRLGGRSPTCAARRRAVLGRTRRADRGARGLCRSGHLGDASCRRDRRADGRALRADRPAPVGAVAGRRARPRRGRRPARSSTAAMSGWCRTRLPCLPCQQEGCERHLDSLSRCLDELLSRRFLPRSTRRSRRPRIAPAGASGASG